MRRYLLDAFIGFLLIIGGMFLAGFLADLVMPEVRVIYLFFLGLCLLPFLFFAHKRKAIVLSRESMLYLALFIILYVLAISVLTRLIPAGARQELYISEDNPWFFISIFLTNIWLAKGISKSILRRLRKSGQSETSP